MNDAGVEKGAATQARKAIAIYRIGSLGDTIVALPCFHAIARSFPDTDKYLITNVPVSNKAAPIQSILGAESYFYDQIISYPISTRSILLLFELWTKCRSLNADTLIYITPPRGFLQSIRDWLFFRTAGFRTIVGMPFGDLSRCKADENGVLEREASRLARSIAKLEMVDLANRTNWDLRLTAEEWSVGRRAVSMLEHTPYLAINMGGKDEIKDWGRANWLLLVEGLAREFEDFGLLVIGASEDDERAEEVLLRWAGPKVNACGTLTPREAAAAIAGAAAFVGHDSGPMHLAACMEVQCVALFGHNNKAAQWHPFGENHINFHNMNSVGSISVSSVQNAVKSVLIRFKHDE